MSNLLLPHSIRSSSWVARRHSLHFSSPPTSLFTLPFLSSSSPLLPLHFPPPPFILLSPFGRIVFGASFSLYIRFEEVYVPDCPYSSAGSAAACGGCSSSPSSSEPVFDLRRRSSFRRVELFSHYNDLAD